jgi:hypothetical protein
MSWESFTSNRLPLLNLPADILEALRAGRIEYTKAKEIAKLESESERLELLEEASASSLSLSEIRERIKALQPPSGSPPLAKRMESVYKLAKKHHVWDDSSKRSRLESLLAQMEELISSGGLDESQPQKEVEAIEKEPPKAESLEDTSLLESEKDPLESRKDVTEPMESDSSQLPPETAEVPDEKETLSNELLDEPQPDGQEELTPTEMSKRLGVAKSTLSVAKKRPDFADWSKSRDPEAIAWQWIEESKRFLPLEN